MLRAVAVNVIKCATIARFNFGVYQLNRQSILNKSANPFDDLAGQALHCDHCDPLYQWRCNSALGSNWTQACASSPCPFERAPPSYPFTLIIKLCRRKACIRRLRVACSLLASDSVIIITDHKCASSRIPIAKGVTRRASRRHKCASSRIHLAKCVTRRGSRPC